MTTFLSYDDILGSIIVTGNSDAYCHFSNYEHHVYLLNC